MPEIQALFARISPAYDRLNFVLSLGLDRLWRRRVLKTLRKLLPPQSHSAKVLDACTGTGDLAILMARHGYRVFGVDFCAPMLEKAAEKAPEGDFLTLTEADVTRLPYSDRSFQAVTSAFSLRNLPNLKETFLETHRVLVPGGVALFLDLTRPQSRLRPFHAFYLRHIVPVIGRLMSGDPQAYGYLSKSIFDFKPPEEIKSLLSSCGFRKVTVEPLSGGICTLWTAEK